MRNIEYELLKARQDYRDCLNMILKSTPIRLDIYKYLIVKIELCRQLLIEYRRNYKYSNIKVNTKGV